MPCCPIEIGEVEQSVLIPDDPANEGEQAGKTVRPLALEGDKAQQDIEQQGGPELPADGMLGVTGEVAQLEGPRLLVHPVLAGKFFSQVRWDKFTKLMQCVAVVSGRRYFFNQQDSLVGIRRRPPFFNWSLTGPQLHPMG